MAKRLSLDHKTVLISRTDSIGDVVLTLPICVWLKHKFPTCKVIFLGNTYTKPILECLPEIDEVLNWSDFHVLPTQERIQKLKSLNCDTIIHVFPNKDLARLAKQATIPNRIGTSHRAFHLLTCNYRLNFTRKSSPFHEAQLNFELLKPFGLTELPQLEEISNMLQSFRAKNESLPQAIEASFVKQGKKYILHPKSQGSAREWPFEKYQKLANLLLEQNHIVYFTGTEKEGDAFRSQIPNHPNCYDTTGLFTLDQLLTFISSCDGLVACSTGPLHVAGILGLRTIGLFSPRKPIHPGRWKALGSDVHILVFDENCEKCKQKKTCNCIEEIHAETVFQTLISHKKN
jgi:ADP-heptose:LPS heptosyltransferase